VTDVVLFLNLYLVKPLVVRSYVNASWKRAADPDKAAQFGSERSERRGFNSHHLQINSNVDFPLAESRPVEGDGHFQASNERARWGYDDHSHSNPFGQDWRAFGGSQFTKIERNQGNQKTNINESNITQNMNIYFGDQNPNASRQHSYVSDPELAEEISPQKLFKGLIMSGITSLRVPNKMQESTPINPLRIENRGKEEYAVEANENKGKLSDWSIPENISDSALNVQAELINRTLPKSSQLVRQS
jgi:hypothetical protein